MFGVSKNIKNVRIRRVFAVQFLVKKHSLQVKINPSCEVIGVKSELIVDNPRFFLKNQNCS